MENITDTGVTNNIKITASYLIYYKRYRSETGNTRGTKDYRPETRK